MKHIPLLILLSAAVLLAGTVGWSQDKPNPARDFPNVVAMEPGDTYLLHSSSDTVIEVYVDTGGQATNERVKVQVGDSKGKLALPTGAAVRLQGQVLVSRETTARAIPKINVRWRHVDTIFRTYSRPRNPPGEKQE